MGLNPMQPCTSHSSLTSDVGALSKLLKPRAGPQDGAAAGGGERYGCQQPGRCAARRRASTSWARAAADTEEVAHICWSWHGAQRGTYRRSRVTSDDVLRGRNRRATASASPASSPRPSIDSATNPPATNPAQAMPSRQARREHPSSPSMTASHPASPSTLSLPITVGGIGGVEEGDSKIGAVRESV